MINKQMINDSLPLFFLKPPKYSFKTRWAVNFTFLKKKGNKKVTIYKVQTTLIVTKEPWQFMCSSLIQRGSD